jgi:DNA uptake protein ComE-like DNA-binding protein
MRSVGCFSRSRRCGAALALVLWISLGLAGMALYFGHDMLFEYRASANVVGIYQSERILEAARCYISTVLENRETAGILPTLNDEYYADDVRVGNEGTFWIVGRANDAETARTVTYGLTDEASKLNLNTATQEMLELLPNMTTELAAAIIDWRDSDSDATDDGAESDTYSRKEPSYQCKNASFETPEELHLVNGATVALLYGEDSNFNGILDSWEDDSNETPPEDNGNGELEPGLLEYLTVWSSEPTTGADGSTARTDVNGSDAQQTLTTLLTEKISESRASEIVQAAGVGTTQFTSLLQFCSLGKITAAEYFKIHTEITLGTAERKGLVNVNTASAAVLACIPGIGETYAQKLVSYRDGLKSTTNSGSTSSSDSSETGLPWVLNVLDEENALKAGPYLTDQSWQISADVVATGENGRGMRRAFMVFDASATTPKLIYQRDRTAWGWPLSSEVRTQLESSQSNN